MKGTLHMGKQAPSKHNDRQYDTTDDKHIDDVMKALNEYFVLQYGYKGMTFEEMELEYYKRNYSEALKEQNNKYIKKGQKDRLKTIEDWAYNDKKKMPDEIILQIGNKDEHYDGETLLICLEDFRKIVENRYGKNFKMFNMVLHVDEKNGTPHAHLRGVFEYEENGIKKIGTDKALKSLGIQPPKPHEKIGRYNNRKQTFTDDIRKIWYEVIKSHGIEIDEEVKNPSQKHLETQNYKIQQNEKTLKEQEEEIRSNNNILNGRKYKDILDELIEDLKDVYKNSNDRTIKQIAKNIYDNLRISYKEKGLKPYKELDRPTEELNR